MYFAPKRAARRIAQRIGNGLRAVFLWAWRGVGSIDRVDVFVLGGIGLIGWGGAQSDLGGAAMLCGALLALIGVRGAAKTWRG